MAPGHVAPEVATDAVNGSVPVDYSAQWVEYYRSVGRNQEAEKLEAQMQQTVTYDLRVFSIVVGIGNKQL